MRTASLTSKNCVHEILFYKNISSVQYGPNSTKHSTNAANILKAYNSAIKTKNTEYSYSKKQFSSKAIFYDYSHKLLQSNFHKKIFRHQLL